MWSNKTFQLVVWMCCWKLKDDMNKWKKQFSFVSWNTPRSLNKDNAKKKKENKSVTLQLIDRNVV